MIAAVAMILPGAHTDDNAPIVSGKIIETAADTNGSITIDAATIAASKNQDRLGQNVLGTTNGSATVSMV